MSRGKKEGGGGNCTIITENKGWNLPKLIGKEVAEFLVEKTKIHQNKCASVSCAQKREKKNAWVVKARTFFFAAEDLSLCYQSHNNGKQRALKIFEQNCTKIELRKFLRTVQIHPSNHPSIQRHHVFYVFRSTSCEQKKKPASFFHRYLSFFSPIHTVKNGHADGAPKSQAHARSHARSCTFASIHMNSR